MPTSIPYDPSLVLANVVEQSRIQNVVTISQEQAKVDSAQEKLNSLLAARRSLDMTQTELQTMGINIDTLVGKIEALNDKIRKAATEYAAAKMAAEDVIAPLRAQGQMVHSSVESPVDYNKTDIKKMALSTNSISMDVQYFNREENREDAQSFARTIGSYVSGKTGWMGITTSAEITKNSQNQVSSQVQEHDIAGTLVISISCTHKNAYLLAPLIINPDKGIKVWNHIFSNDPIDPTNMAEMQRLSQEASTSGKAEKHFSIVSGMTYGSSFVGMVHILNTTKTSVSQSLDSVVSSVQQTIDASLWIKGTSGGFGIDRAATDQVKSLLSQQNVTSHVTLICMGVIPSIAANQLKLGVAKFAEMSPEKDMEAIAKLQNATATDQENVQKSSMAARNGESMISLQTAKIESALSALGEMAERSDKVLDINSMMAALEDFVTKASEGDGGVPINVYLKDITKLDLAELWIAKYFPQKTQIRIDDSERTNPGGST